MGCLCPSGVRHCEKGEGAVREAEGVALRDGTHVDLSCFGWRCY